MSKNITKTESNLPSRQSASSLEINQNIDLLMMLNFMRQVASAKNQISEAKEQAQNHRKFRKPKGMSNAKVMKRSNDRAARVASPKVNRHLLQIENGTEFSKECLEIIDRLNLTPEDKGLLLNLTETMKSRFSDDALKAIYNSLKDYQTGGMMLFISKIISVSDILNHTGSYGLKAAVQSVERVNNAADAIAVRTTISRADAKRLLDGIYNALQPRAENFITACVSSKPLENELAYKEAEPIIIGSVIGGIIWAVVLCAGIYYGCKKLESRHNALIHQDDDFDYSHLDELIKYNNFDEAQDFILIKEGQITNDPNVIINCLKRVFFESDKKFNEFFKGLKARLEELVIGDQNKDILRRAIEVGIKQRTTIAKIVNVMNGSLSLPNINCENIVSFLDMKDRAVMAAVAKPQNPYNMAVDDDTEYKNAVKIHIKPSSNPIMPKYERLKDEIEMSGGRSD